VAQPFRFVLDRLPSYDDQSLVAELQRVAAIESDGPFTREAFDRHARVDSSTILRRLGDWQHALARAGLPDRYSGRPVSQRMRDQRTRSMSEDELLDELRAVAAALGTTTLTREAFRRHSNGVSDAGVTRRFGSWSEALRQAGLELAALGRRWSDDDYHENLLTVWTLYGRAPTYAEMNRQPSRISNGAYAKRWGTWGRAKAAFVERVNADLTDGPATARVPRAEAMPVGSPRSTIKPEDRRSIPLGLRYRVLSRDRFRCVLCGRSPATDLAVTLHVDHIVPVASGGKTTEDNLRACCAGCNLGKGARVPTENP